MFLCSEEGTALITTAGDKVQVSGAVKTLGLAVHVARVEGRGSGWGDGTHHSAVTKAVGESGEPPVYFVSALNNAGLHFLVIGATRPY